MSTDSDDGAAVGDVADSEDEWGSIDGGGDVLDAFAAFNLRVRAPENHPRHR